jgi:hypothetical protein
MSAVLARLSATLVAETGRALRAAEEASARLYQGCKDWSCGGNDADGSGCAGHLQDHERQVAGGNEIEDHHP